MTEVLLKLVKNYFLKLQYVVDRTSVKCSKTELLEKNVTCLDAMLMSDLDKSF